MYNLIATTAFGLEAVTARELKQLGFQQVRVENGRVRFQGDEEAIARTNLWLRTADRVLVDVGEFRATTFDELFEGVKAMPWPDFLPRNASFPVQGKSVRSGLFSVSDCQAITKKAIVESMKKSYHLEWFPEDGPTYQVQVSLLKDIATLTIDTSGRGLHKRGYRQLTGPAPLKETLAAALILLSYWTPERVLIDPFCGTGTIPIEAALIAHNIAPGISRQFAAESWPNIAPSCWDMVRNQARDAVTKDTRLKIRGTDIDGEVLRLARYHAKLAGVEMSIHFQQLPVDRVRSSDKYGCVICNPPYGVRLEDQKNAALLYRSLGSLSKLLDTWSFYVLTADHGFEAYFGRQADRKRKLFNGRIECTYYQMFGPPPPRRPVMEDN